jgi:hypothetical protein
MQETLAAPRHHYRGGLVWPVILIGAGVVFLLNNLGLLSWNVWGTLFRLWPVLLIAIGLDILFGRKSIIGSLIVALLLVMVLGVAISIGAPNWDFSGVGAVDRTETINVELKDASRADVEIDFGTGSLQLAALPADSQTLVKGSADLSRTERLQVDQSSSGGTARVTVRSSHDQLPLTNSVNDRKRWELDLNRNVPLNLRVDLGVGTSTLDLSQLQLAELQVDGGVAEATTKLPAVGRFDVKINGGIGQMTIIIPQGLAVHLQVDGGIGNVNVTGNFDRNGQEYTSPNFNSAANRANITVDGGIGQIVVRQVSE